MLPKGFGHTGKSLTGAALTKIKADAAKRQEVPDGVVVGLYFVVQPTGRKSWAVRYRFNGKPRKMALGNYLAGVDANKAGQELVRLRREAGDILESIRAGADPASEKQVAKRHAKGRSSRTSATPSATAQPIMGPLSTRFLLQTFGSGQNGSSPTPCQITPKPSSTGHAQGAISGDQMDTSRNAPITTAVDTATNAANHSRDRSSADLLF